MEQKEINKHLKQGWLQAIITFEVAGKPQPHVESSIKNYVEQVKKNKALIEVAGELGETEKHEDGMFSAFYEGEFLVKSLEDLTWICVNYTPASIEVLEPAKYAAKASELTNWFNDLLSRLHEVGTKFKSVSNVNQKMVEALNALLQNSILLAIDSGLNSQKEIAASLGVAQKQLEPFLKHFVEKGTLSKKGQQYTRS